MWQEFQLAEVSSDRTHTIRGIAPQSRPPSDLKPDSAEAEQAATANGYAAQLVALTSKIAGVPLRYTPVFAESRSYVLDDATRRPAARWPLFLAKGGGAAASLAMERGESALKACVGQLTEAAVVVRARAYAAGTGGGRAVERPAAELPATEPAVSRCISGTVLSGLYQLGGKLRYLAAAAFGGPLPLNASTGTGIGTGSAADVRSLASSSSDPSDYLYEWVARQISESRPRSIEGGEYRFDAESARLAWSERSLWPLRPTLLGLGDRSLRQSSVAGSQAGNHEGTAGSSEPSSKARPLSRTNSAHAEPGRS